MSSFPFFSDTGSTTSKFHLGPVSQPFGKSADNLPKRDCGHVTRPKTRKEQLAWLALDAQRILRDPLNYRAEESTWARELLSVADNEGVKQP